MYPIKCIPTSLLLEGHHSTPIQSSISLSNRHSPSSPWHFRLGHMHFNALKTLQCNNLVHGLPKEPFKPISLCESCILGKMPQQPFPKHRSRASTPLALVHSDLCGPFPTPSLSGAKYFISFIDDFSRFTILHFLKYKSQAYQAFKEYKARVEVQTSSKIKSLQTDGGGEYMSHEFQSLYQNEGIHHRISTPHTPQQNGVSERRNRSLLNMARSMLQFSHLSPQFWEEAVGTACYIQNRGFHRSLGLQTPYELWHGHKPNLSNLRIFGCDAYAFVPNVQRNKLDPRATKSIFIGYGEASGYKAYKLYDAQKRRIFFSRNVIFQENGLSTKVSSSFSSSLSCNLPPLLPTPTHLQPPSSTISNINNSHTKGANIGSSSTSTICVALPSNHKAKINPTQPTNSSPPPSFQSLDDSLPHNPLNTQCVTPSNNTNNVIFSTPSPNPSFQASSLTSPPTSPPPKYRSLNNIYEQLDQMEAHFVDLDHEAYIQEEDIPILSDDTNLSAKDALSGSDSIKWRKAMEEEMKALLKNGTWTLVEPPKDRQIIGSKWVLRIKRDSNGNPIRFKARVVARGFSQVPGLDFQDTFSPTLKICGFRMLVALAAQHDLELHHLDVQTAFLHGDLDEELYLQQPQFFEDPSHPTHVCRLRKSIYGLKQSPRIWYHKLHSFLIKVGYHRLNNEPNIYIRKAKCNFVIIGVYVDDLPLISNSKSYLTIAKKELAYVFPITDLGPMTHFLGIKITQNRTKHTISLSQSNYINSILQRFDMLHSKPISTPLTSPCKLSNDDSPKNEREISEMKDVPYKQILGCIRYLVSCTRLDICFAAGFLSRFMANPGPKHWIALKRLLRYLKHTQHYALTYSATQSESTTLVQGWTNPSSQLTGWSDSDWGGDVDDRKSTGGYVYTLAGAAISWKSKKQTTVALSSTEAEYVAAALAAKEGIWIKAMLEEFKLFAIPTMALFCDNQSCIKLASNPNMRDNIRHVDLKHHFLRDLIETKKIELKFAPTHICNMIQYSWLEY